MSIHSSHYGFTLIEVLLAMTILAVGILGVTGAFSLCMQVTSRSDRLAQAANIAEKQLELAAADLIESAEAEIDPSGKYTWAVSFSDKPHGLRLASVTVNWSEKGQPHMFRLSRVLISREQGTGRTDDND